MFKVYGPGLWSPVEKELRRKRGLLRGARDHLIFGALILGIIAVCVIAASIACGFFLALPLWPFLLCAAYWIFVCVASSVIQKNIGKVEDDLRRELAGQGRHTLDTVFDDIETRTHWWGG